MDLLLLHAVVEDVEHQDSAHRLCVVQTCIIKHHIKTAAGQSYEFGLRIVRIQIHDPTLQNQLAPDPT